MQTLQIKNKKGRVTLNDIVHKFSVDDAIEELERLYGETAKLDDQDAAICEDGEEVDELVFEINSPGGVVDEGIRLYNTLRMLSDRGIKVVTVVNGLAASMGSVIFMAGDERQMMRGSRLMVHNPSTVTRGDHNAHANMADHLEEMRDELVEIYADNTGLSREEIKAMMDKETYLYGAEAKAKGFATKTKVDKADQVNNLGPMSFWKNLFGIESKPANVEELDFEDAGAKFEAKEAEVEALKVELREAREAGVANETAKLEAENKLASAQDEITALKTENAELTEKASAEAIAEKVAEQLRAAGQPQAAQTDDLPPEETKEKILAEYRKLPAGKQRSEFRAKHKEHFN